MRLAGTKLAANHQYRGFGDQLYDLSGERPSLDLNFANTKSLVDATTGQNLVTFTRASSATYVDSQGVIRTATTNLLLQSEDLGTTWTRLDGLQLSTNQIVAPNGSTTADLLTGNGSQIGYLEQPTASSNQFTNGITYTFSIYLKKANTSTVLTLLFGATFNSGGSNPVATWNLDTGIPSFSNGATGSMTPVGNGWYRCVLTDTATATETRNQQWLRMSSTSGDVYAWGAQLEQSSTVGEYIPTTSTINSAPRFDHNPTTGESLGLLVEEQRTNSFLQSQNFSTTWTLNAVTLGSSIAAPDGTTTAQKLEETQTTAEHRVTQASASGATTAAVTFTVFAKAAERTKIRLAFSNVTSWSGGGGAAVIFDLSEGTASANASTPTAFSITPYPNGWYRCSVTGTPTSSLTPTGSVFLYTTTSTYAGTLGEGLYLWGAQLEAGAFPTSYIPTTTAAVTRSADVASITGSNFSSWYRQDEGTVFADARHFRNFDGTNRFPRLFSINDGSGAANSIELIYALQSGNLTTAVPSIRVANILQANTAITGEQNGKAQVLAYALNNVNAASGGTLSTQDNSAAIPTVNQALIGYVSSSSDTLNGTIKRLTYFPARLANETLQRITQ